MDTYSAQCRYSEGMKARHAKKLLQRFLSAQVLVVPEGSMLCFRSDDIDQDDLQGVREMMLNRGISFKVLLAVSAQTELTVVQEGPVADVTSTSCQSVTLVNPSVPETPSK